MTLEGNARSFAEDFRWNVGPEDMTVDETRLHDLIALRAATVELIREQRELLNDYDAAQRTKHYPAVETSGAPSCGTIRAESRNAVPD